MPIERRQLLQFLSVAIGSGSLFAGQRLSAAAQCNTGNAPGHAPSAESVKEKVTGIGGFFFRAKDPKALALWYQEHLGITTIPESYGGTPWQQEAGITAFAPFPEKTGYFGDPNKDWMLNFRVRDLDKMAAQLRSAGIKVDVDPQTYPNGLFASLKDPEGNPIQLWQPMSPHPAK